MNIGKLAVIAAALGAAAFWWKGRGDVLADAARSPNGFVAAPMPDGARANTVLILTPLNCPSDAAQRAAGLAAELSRRGIPNVKDDSYQLNIAEPTAEQEAGMQRAVAVMNGAIPAVFVNGMAKANPTAEEVVAEYKRTRAAP